MSKMFISNNPFRRPAGVTLVEILFSAGILSLVLIGTLTIFAHTVDISRRIDYEYTATSIARGRLERLRAAIDTSGFPSLTDANFGETDTELDADGVPDTDGDFRRTTTVTTGYGGDALLTEAEITVTYRYRGVWKTGAAVSVTTLFVDI